MALAEETKSTLSHKLGLFFHRELDRRYRREYLQQIERIRSGNLLDSVPQTHLERIKEFFKRVMYPVGEERHFRDKGVETVASLLGSASSIISLLPRIPGLLVRHGGRLPAISSAGLHVVSSYRTARQLEEKVLDALADLCEEEDIPVDEESDISEELYRKAYGSLTMKETTHMLEQTERIVRLGMDQGLMGATIDILQAVKETRRDPEERGALGYVESVLEEVHSLSEEFSDQEVERILELSEIAEENYFSALPTP